MNEIAKETLHLYHETAITLPFLFELVRQILFLFQQRPVLQFQLSHLREMSQIHERHLSENCANVQRDGVLNHTR